MGLYCGAVASRSLRLDQPFRERIFPRLRRRYALRPRPSALLVERGFWPASKRAIR